MKKRPIIAGILLAAAMAASAPICVSLSDRHLLSKSEDAIYAEVKELATNKLIRKIKRLEKNYPEYQNKIKLLPLYTALIERSDEFSEDELIKLICDKETNEGIDEAFAAMYANQKYDASKLLDLIYGTEISEHTKEFITSNCSFSVDDLSEIFRSTDGKTATIAIKRISATDSETAMYLVNEFLSAESGSISDEKYVSICQGIANYYEEHDTPEDIESMKNIYIPMMKKIFKDGHSTYVKDQAIYALGRICDHDLFAWLIENNDIDKMLKISVTERNYRPMKRWIEAAGSEDDIRAVIEAMKILPILEIADSIEAAINNGNLSESDELRSLIDFIRKEGINAVDKYDY